MDGSSWPDRRDVERRSFAALTLYQMGYREAFEPEAATIADRLVEEVLPMFLIDSAPGDAPYLRQVFGLDLVAARQYHRALDHVLQLAHVARPAILHHAVDRIRRESGQPADHRRLDAPGRRQRDRQLQLELHRRQHGDRRLLRGQLSPSLPDGAARGHREFPDHACRDIDAGSGVSLRRPRPSPNRHCG